MTYQLRHDLQYSRYQSSGREQTVIKDPLRLEYFAFAGIEAQLIHWLQRPRSLPELSQLAAGAGISRPPSEQELQQFMQRLWGDNLLMGLQPGAGQYYHRQQTQRRRPPWWSWPASLISIRFRGINPRPLLDGLLPLGWLLFHPLTLTAIALWFIWSLTFFVLNLDRLIDNTYLWDKLFTPTQVLPLAIAFVVVKLFHELGHALSCRAQGRECHELGVLLLALMPCLYCNVSDIWMEPQKVRRMLVSGAGILVEMLIASLCLPLWLYSRPGEFQFFCFQLFLITSVNTLFVNGNPLLKYDGYFVLSDWLGVPNLADRANRIKQRWVDRWIWGQRDVGIAGNEWPWVLYALVSQAYRWLILFSILTMVLTVFQGWALPHTGGLIVCLLAASLTASVTVQAAQQTLLGSRRRTRNQWIRFAIIALGLALALTTVLALPMPTRVVVAGRTMSSDARFVFAAEAGQITWDVEANQPVRAGQVLGSIRNIELQQELQRVDQAIQILNAKSRFLEIQRQQGVDTAMDLQIAQRLTRSQQQIQATLQARQAALTITAPASGFLRSTPEQQSLPDFDSTQTSHWNGWLREENRGIAAERGDVLAIIETDAPVEVEITVPTAMLDKVAVGYEAWVLIPQVGTEYLKGTVKEVSLERMDSREAQGDRPGPEAMDQFRVLVSLSQCRPLPRDRSAAHVLILGPRRTLGRQFWDYLQKNVVLFASRF